MKKNLNINENDSYKKEKYTREAPLDLLRGFAVCLFFICHLFWHLADNNIKINQYPYRLLFVGMIAPGIFFYITGCSICYKNLGEDNLAYKIIQSLIFLGYGFAYYIIMFQLILIELTNEPLMYIGLFNIILILFSRLLRKNIKIQSIFLIILITLVIMISGLFKYEFPIGFYWPIIPWIIFPFFGYLFTLNFPNNISYSEYDYNFKNNKKSLIFFTIGLIFSIILYFYDNSSIFTNYMIYKRDFFYALYVFSRTIVLYGLFGIFYPILKHIDLFKIFSKYALYIWFFHLFIISIISLIGFRFHTMNEYYFGIVVFTIFIYCFFKLIDYKRMKKLIIER